EFNISVVNNFIKIQLWVLVILLAGKPSPAQEYDLLIKNGHLIDPKNHIDQLMDIAISEGKVAEVSVQIASEKAESIIDATGLYVVPGLIDMHAHVFWGTLHDEYISNSYTSLPPDGFTFRSGVTTVVDAGSAGWKNFKTFREQTIDHSATRVLAFLNIVGSGMKGGAVEQNLRDMDPKLTAMVAGQNADVIVGIKLAHYSGAEWDPLNHTVEAGKLAKMPVMIDFGGHIPELSLETLLLDKLRPGDIFTHCFAHVKGRTSIVDGNGKVRPCVREAQDKGIVFDVGHGGGSFVFDQAIPAMDQGFMPNTISTDLHTGSMNGGMKNMVNIMSKFMNMGMSLQEAVTRSTWNPALYLHREEIGHLSEGAVADIAVLSLKKGNVGFADTKGWKIQGTQKLECELTIRDGKVVWDLNGISMPEWSGASVKE
ncbi:MAG: amidohydrolase/deacetylase family metallohydrolase, partial [Bacteroidales bacterium]|nr:amidohydrolase/deacetylase family metallohydrolase [Bacteroidales bacterium]